MKKIILIFLLPIIFIIYIYENFDVDKMKKDINSNYSQIILDDNGNIIKANLNKEDNYIIEEKGEIPVKFKDCVLTFEDKDFYNHHGIKFSSILRAIKTNIFEKRRVGASTITMQTIKLYKKRPRTYLNKFIEMIESIKLENNLTKEEILKLYLNNSPYGGNIIGYRTASLMYFQKEVKNLSLGEGAFLAVLPNHPRLIKTNRKTLKLKRDALLNKMEKEGLITKNQNKLAKLEKLPKKRYYFENIAPHLSRRLSNEYKNMQEIHSTINKSMQIRINKIVKDYSEHISNYGINNVCTLVVDNKTGNVKAYVGSQDFFDYKADGQVDGNMALRSVGSVLKPFLFALSMDDGIIVPESVVMDIPMYFGNFSPENSDKHYRGLVSINNALQKSLNIPFVNLLRDYGEEKFYKFLKEITNFDENNPSRYGLSLILGTKEMRVEDIATLYYGLANYGNFKNINYIKNDKNSKAKKLISTGSSYKTLETLKGVSRDGDFNLYTNYDNIAWKTGTSYGRRDAWACGVNPNYTVIVWAGNFSGLGNQNLSGVKTAGNLLFNIFKVLPNNNEDFIFPKENMKKIKIDAKTGYRLKYDVESKEIFVDKNSLPLKYSPYYKKIYEYNGKNIDSRDKNFYLAKEKIILSYPSKLLNYFVSQKIDTKEFMGNSNINFIYPLNNLKIKVPRDFTGVQKVILKISNPNNENIFWYINGVYFGKSKDLQKSFDLKKGEQNITIISESGKMSHVSFVIE